MSVSHKTYPRRCVCARIYEFAMDRTRNGDNTRSGEQSPPTGSIRTIFAAISMLASERVGGRALPLDAAPEATSGTRGGCSWFNWGSARFRLESPRCFWGSSLNRQGRRQGRQSQDCAARVLRGSGQSILSFSGSARRWDQGRRAIAYGWQACNRWSDFSMPQPMRLPC